MNRRTLLWILGTAALVIAALVGLVLRPGLPPGVPREDTALSSRAEPAATRIVSLVPSATEMLFAIGAGPQMVAVSSFDQYPPEVASLPRVGALIDPDVERILSLEPDLVVVYGTQRDLRAQLERARIPVFSYTHGGIGDALDAMRALGARTGHREPASSLAARIGADLAALRNRVQGRRRPQTLLVLGREPLTLRGVYASGGRGFLHEMLTIAGGSNVFGDVDRENVQPSTESLLARAPEVIVELRPGAPPDAATIAREQDAWRSLAAVPAVQRKRVHLLYGNALLVAGPRIVWATEQLARAIHPDAFQP
jgi:cobalamin transport system substrate-binding protein